MSWRDAALHIPMGLGFAAISLAAFTLLPLPLACAATASWEILLREATQWQEDAKPRPSWKFIRGWRETALTAETLGPIAALLVIGVILNEWF